ncbi:hypothetical protein IEO21_08813 [Rhodonia placenta]|uniref:F-box domain-containing protein n=1 Tax=Rhodonia placenta TaxID=104341 RepID=A0A8H7TYD0_9APHY|nr:hypothetical protein IEO21_08813 [Postia placenta]
MPDLLALCDDVLQLILPLLSQNDAIHLSLTCRTGYDIALPRILHTVRFNTLNEMMPPPQCERRLLEFCTFVLADVVRRASLLRIMEISPSAYTFIGRTGEFQVDGRPFMAALADILKHASNLLELSLYLPKIIVRDDSSLLESVAALPRLRSLEIDIPADLCRVLAKTVSRPRRLVLELTPRWPGLHLDVLFTSNLMAGVEELHIDISSLKIPRMRFLQVQHLTISNMGCEDQINLSETFPNLRSLSLNACLAYNRLSGSPLIGTLPELDYVKYTNTDIQTFCYRGLVRRLAFTARGADKDLIKVIQQSSPVVLDCAFNSPPMLRKLRRAAPELRVLRIRINFNELAGISGDHIPFAFLAKLPLTAISIRASWFDPHLWIPGVASRVITYMARRISTAEYVELSLASGMDYPDQGIWHKIISRHDQVCTLERLPRWESDVVESRLLAMPRL